MAFAGPTIDAGPRLEQAEAELPRSAFLERHRLLLSILVPIASMGAVSANALIGYDTNHSFRIHHEGWFGRNTTNGGADKASHLTDYFVIASLFQDVYRMLGYSENAAILWGFGVALATGNDLGVKRNTWWGYSLHLIDNIRFPFTAVRMRLDLNRGRWHGPNSGNFD